MSPSGGLGQTNLGLFRGPVSKFVALAGARVPYFRPGCVCPGTSSVNISLLPERIGRQSTRGVVPSRAILPEPHNINFNALPLTVGCGVRLGMGWSRLRLPCRDWLEHPGLCLGESRMVVQAY